jgi:uncharacterized membrane protein
MGTPVADESGIERAVRALMLTAVAASTVCLVVGLALWLLQGDDRWGLRLVTVGLVTLMATPILRVVLSAAEAVRMKDWIYLATIVAVAVLLTLAVSVAMVNQFGP